MQIQIVPTHEITLRFTFKIRRAVLPYRNEPENGTRYKADHCNLYEKCQNDVKIQGNY